MSTCRRLLSTFAVALMLATTSAPAPAQDTEADALLELAGQKWIGDLDGMIDRGFVRILTAYNPIYFSYNGDAESGLAADIARAFQARLIEWYGKKGKSLTVITVPVPRDELIPRLLAGQGDIIVANMTVTPERAKSVQFSDPVGSGVRELVVTSKTVGPIADLDALAGRTLSLRPSSSYFEHMTEINAARATAGKPTIEIEPMAEVLEDYDVLELLNAGVLEATIVDGHKARLWAQVFKNIVVNTDVAVNEGGAIAWAIRPDSPQLLEGVNRFMDVFKKGTLLGNILIKRYFKDTDWIENNLDDANSEKFDRVIGLIQEKSDKYGFDWLMIASQGFQESRLDQSKRSHVGAVGIMQVMPATANDPAVGIPNIEEEEANVEAGVKYLNWLRETYFDDPTIAEADQALFAFAAYNAGPGNLARARTRAKKMNLDPNVWFGNVEIAAARSISQEPVIYVRNIMKYYVAYKRAYDLVTDRAQ